VEGDRYAIGYFGLAYYVEAGQELNAVEVDGGDGCVAPSAEAAQSGEYAPYSRPLFIYTDASILEERDELYRIRRPVDPKFEMPALMEQIEQKRKAFVFDNVNGAAFPVVCGILNRIECYGWALGSRPGEPFSAADMDARFEAAKLATIPPREVATGPVKEVVRTGAEINLADLPVPTVFELDSGDHHDHMVCVESGKVIEFHNQEIERLQDQIARQHGYEITGHSLVLYVKPKKSN